MSSEMQKSNLNRVWVVSTRIFCGFTVYFWKHSVKLAGKLFGFRAESNIWFWLRKTSKYTLSLDLWRLHIIIILRFDRKPYFHIFSCVAADAKSSFFLTKTISDGFRWTLPVSKYAPPCLDLMEILYFYEMRGSCKTWWSWSILRVSGKMEKF